MGVAGAQGTGLGLHPDGGVAPAPAHGGQYVHGVVPGVEEHPAPQVGDTVRASGRDADQTAAGADARQIGLGDLVPQARGQRGQHGEGEECLERAGRRQFAVRVVRGEHLTGAGVGHQPRQRGHVPGEAGCAGPEPGLGARAVQHTSVRRRRCAGVGTGAGGRRDGRERQDARHAQRTAGGGDPGRESDGHTANVRMDEPNTALPGPLGEPEHPDATPGSARAPEGVATRRAASAGSAAGRSRCRACCGAAPGASPGSPGRPVSAGPAAAPVRSSTRPGTAGVPRGGCRTG